MVSPPRSRSVLVGKAIGLPVDVPGHACTAAFFAIDPTTPEGLTILHPPMAW